MGMPTQKRKVHKTASVGTRCKEGRIEGGKPRPLDEILSLPWRLVVAFVALLDFLSTMANRRLFLYGEENDFGAYIRIFGRNFDVPFHFITKIFLWLDEHSGALGLAFSVLWFLDAFMVAERDAYRALREWDRREQLRLLRGALQGAASKITPGYESTDYERFMTYAIYWYNVILQLLKLPVGFYLIVIQFARMKASSGGGTEDLVSPDDMKVLLESTYEYEDAPEEYRIFTNETKLSLGFAIAKHSGKAMYKAANSRMRQQMWKTGWLQGRKLGWNFVIHPIQTVQDMRWSLYWVRWILYLIPLVQGVFKMQGKLKELIMTWKQQRQRKIAKIKRMAEWLRMNEVQREEKAAKTIQSTYRSYRIRQACVKLIRARREMDDNAAQKLQFAFRALCEKSKARKEKKKSELAKLESRHRNALRVARRDTVMLTPLDRERLGELRTQFMASRTIDRRLLMKPDSKFIVIWKTIFVCAVLLELANYGLNHSLAKQHSSVSQEIQKFVLPVRVSHRKECYCLAKARGDPFKYERFRTKRPRMKCNMEPWYCTPIYLHLQSIYTDIFLMLKYHFRGMLAIFALLDVPFAFFTGVYHPDTGVLVGKPFLQRWPGVIIQLMVNPQFETASKVVHKLLRSMYQIGPIRVIRWCRALFYPALLVFLKILERSVWMPTVSFLNQKPLPLPASEKQAVAQRRSSIDPRRTSIFVPMVTPGMPAQSGPNFARSRSSIALAAGFAILDDPYEKKNR